MPYTFKNVEQEHLPILAEILNHYVLNTTITFYKQPLTPADMAGKVFFDQPYYQSFVVEENGRVIGYCAVSQWKKQEAYRHTGEINIYLHHDSTGKGIGSTAIAHLEQFARANGICNLIAGLCSENIPSKRLFEKNGYSLCGTFREVGNKFERILDVVYLQKILS